MKNSINWKLYLILLSACIISIFAVMPYSFTLVGEAIKQSPLPFPLLVVVALIQSSILFAVVIFIGLKLSNKLGLGLPIIEGYLAKRKLEPGVGRTVRAAVGLGIAAGLAIILIDLIFFKAGVGISLWSGQMPPYWMGLLASFYGGISEEILLRLFLMTVLVWLFNKFRKSGSNILNSTPAMWLAIIIASVIFGLGHLPATASVTAITGAVVLRAIVLNGIGGLIFGWLYWKKGLEAAMISHFSADICLHVILPLIALLFM
jgi:membrane protease YdiL (CAAX protease family)